MRRGVEPSFAPLFVPGARFRLVNLGKLGALVLPEGTRAGDPVLYLGKDSSHPVAYLPASDAIAKL